MTSGCGHKQRSVLFAQEVERKRLPKLMFPAPRNLKVHVQHDGNCISWDALEAPHTASLLGYNVYRITRKNCIPRISLNSQPIIETQFLDNKKHFANATHYIVHGVFQNNDITINGPFSCMIKKAS